MSDEATSDVGRLIRENREAKGMSVRGLAAAAKVDSTWLSRVEHGIHANPDPRGLHRLARVLGMETMELFTAANYADGLPNFSPYLRSASDLSDSEIAQLQAHFDLMIELHRQNHGEAA